MYIIKDRKTKLSNMIRNIKDEQEDLNIEKGKINGFIYDIKLAINEFFYRSSLPDLNNYINHLSNFLEETSESKTGLELKEVITKYYNLLNEIDYNQMPGVYYNTYSEINDRIMTSISNYIINNNRPFNVFDSKCGYGNLLKNIKEIKTQAILYGLEENNRKAEKAKEVADRIIKGVVKGSRISNDVFDMVICTPEIFPYLEDNMSVGTISKQERNYIVSNLKYLRNDGIFFVALPFYRLHKDICTLLARQLKNVSIIKGLDEDKTKGIVYIIGQKDGSKILDEEIYELLRKGYNYDNVSYIGTADINNFILPNKIKTIDLFKGSLIDTDELLNIVKTSGCKDSFFEKQNVRKINENIIQPLLPFNVGQIGLVLTSGCLDGLIDEGDGNFHLVKGRVSKKSNKERSYESGEVQEVETITNKVEINVILPSGEFKTLA
jgi:hypothetical protein